MINKAYIGDGVYIQFTGYSIILTTENGISVTNEIHLEFNMIKIIEDFKNTNIEIQKERND